MDNQGMERREFLKKSLGLLAGVGLMAFLPNMACSQERKKGKRRKFAVDSTKCDGCKKCTKECDHEAITLKDGKAIIDAKSCTGCSHCVPVCKRRAISEIKS